MFDEILGLPAHPLIIHAAVVFTPLAVLLAVAYAVVPRWRPLTGWAVAILSVVAPVSVLAARLSGEALKERLFADGLPEQMAGPITEHESFSGPLLAATAGLGVAGLLMVFAGRRLGKVPAALLSGVTVVLAVVAAYYVFRAGDSGATAVWG